MILEKGVWEDMFPLGEGQLHLKLQVVLSDEERDRIRMMVLISLRNFFCSTSCICASEFKHCKLNYW
jgi:hypothetical protein